MTDGPHGLDDKQHDTRIIRSALASGLVDEPGSDYLLPRRPANTATPEAVAASTPLSPHRHEFLQALAGRAGLSIRSEAEHWALGVFDALRYHALSADPSFRSRLSGVVRVGEAPEVQRDEMLWGGNFVERLVEFVSFLQTWNRESFLHKVAEEAGVKFDGPTVEAAVLGFFAAMKQQLGSEATNCVPHLGEIESLWQEA
ncbi:MAG: hypothetical protein NVS4B8_00240 [Herpetosiphon sp.]